MHQGASPFSESKPGDGLLSCTVVVCTRNRPGHLDKCLASLSTLDYPRYEVLVVDNGSDPSIAGISEKWKARYLHCSEGRLSYARNVGSFAALGDIVAYVDDDAIVDRQWVKSLLAEFTDPAVMVVTGRTLAMPEEAGSNIILTEAKALGDDRQERSLLNRSTADWFARSNFGGIGEGGNMAFRRSVFQWWKGFDERLGRGAPLPGGEEHYAFFQIVEAGHTIVYTPYAIIFHPLPQSLEQLRKERKLIITCNTAYATLLLVDRPRYFVDILRIGWGFLSRTPRDWRVRAASDSATSSRWEILRAILAGPFLYLKTLSHFHPARKPASDYAESDNARTNSR